MRKLRALWSRLAATLGFTPAKARASDIEAELRSHLELQIAENIRRGFAPADARRQALLAAGGLAVAAESVRDQYRLVWLEQLLADIRYAFRALAAHPFFTLAVVVTLSAGVGVNVVMFGVLDRTLVRAPRYLRDPDSVNRIYLEWSAASGQRVRTRRTEYPRYADLARWNRSLTALAAFAHRRAAMGTGDLAREMDIAAVSANFFDFFNARPVIGRYFTPHEDTPPTGAPVAVLGFDYWRADHGGSQAVLGQPLMIGSVRYTIIGVAPRGFDGIGDGVRPAAFVPAATYGASMRPAYHNRYTWTYVALLGRRKPGVSIDAANLDLTSALRMSWAAEHGADVSAASDFPEKPTAAAEPLQLDRGPQARPESRIAIWVGGVAVIVLLIACANVANLLLTHGVRRRRELAVRRAIGGTPARILRQVLIESSMFAAIGGVGGLVGASLAASVLRRALVGAAAPWPVISDGRTLAFAAALALVTAILAGIVPALQARGGNLAGSLKAGFRELAYQRSRLGGALLLVQTALCVVLLIGAGLFVRSLIEVRATRVGYDPERLLYLQTVMRGTSLPAGQRIALAERLLAEARTIPGVSAASSAISVPFRGGETQDLHVAGIDSIRKLGRFELQAGTHEYFATMGTRVLRGRGLSAADRAGTPQVALVSEAMAAVLWPGRDPIGQCFRIDLPTAPCTTVVGIAENIKTRGFDSEGEFHYYLPMSQYVAMLGETDPELFLRVERNPAALVNTVRSRLQQHLPGAAYLTVIPFQEILDPALHSWESGARLFLAFGSLALVLAALGIYAVIAFGVAHRTQEIGMRIALGARTGDVLGLIVGQGLRVAGAGVVLGTAISLVTANSIRELLFEVSPHDPAVYVVVAATLLLASVLACALPAARALRVDPNAALRSE
jgi:predicted permease